MRFFLYGTLMAGIANPVAQDLHRRLRRGEPSSARGALFAIPDPDGWYPALLADAAGGLVRGMIHEALPAFGAADLAALDAYEGAEYRRQAIPVCEGAQAIMAEAWLWRGPLPEHAVPLPHGDFARFLEERGLPVYAPREGYTG